MKRGTSTAVTSTFLKEQVSRTTKELESFISFNIFRIPIFAACDRLGFEPLVAQKLLEKQIPETEAYKIFSSVKAEVDDACDNLIKLLVEDKKLESLTMDLDKLRSLQTTPPKSRSINMVVLD